MLRYDERLRGLSYRTKGHIEVKKHLGMGSLCCNTLDPCCRQLIERVLEIYVQRGVLRVGKMRQTRSRMKRNLKRKICRAFLHMNFSY
jgi:hypothetical protein